jgi:hypothetical protein
LTEQQTLDLPGPRISRITIGRLHNLGNYEHVRYEVTVDMPPGTSPASVLHATEQMLNALDPKPPHSAYEVLTAQRELQKPAPKLADFFDGRDHAYSPEQRLESANNERERALKIVNRQNEWRQRRDAAHRRFDELGGTSLHRDAKVDWDEDEIPF